MLEGNEKEEALRKMDLGKRVLLDASYYGVHFRIVPLSMFRLGYEKPNETEKEIDVMIAEEWGPQFQRSRQITSPTDL